MGEGMPMEDFDAPSCVHEPADTPTSLSMMSSIEPHCTGSGDPSEDEPDEGALREDAQLRIGAIIGRATHQLDDVSEEATPTAYVVESVEPATSAGPDVAEPAILPSPNQRSQPRVALMGTGGVPNPQRAPEIAKILKSIRAPSEVRRYAERAGVGRMPGHLRKATEVLEAEQQYIMSLQEPKEVGPKSLVRLLEPSEKNELLQGLRMQFQQASARTLKEKPRSRARSELEAELRRLRQDIDNLSRPYIFVQVKS